MRRLAPHQMMFEGRIVSRIWHRIHVLNIPQPKRVPKEFPFVKFRVPALHCIEGDQAQTYLQNLKNVHDLKFIREMSGSYTDIQPTDTPTFFPNHP